MTTDETHLAFLHDLFARTCEETDSSFLVEAEYCDRLRDMLCDVWRVAIRDMPDTPPLPLDGAYWRRLFKHLYGRRCFLAALFEYFSYDSGVIRSMWSLINADDNQGAYLMEAVMRVSEIRTIGNKTSVTFQQLSALAKREEY